MDLSKQPPMSGDDDLAKALAGDLQFEETPVASTSSAPQLPTAAPLNDQPAEPSKDEPLAPAPEPIMPTPPVVPSDDASANDTPADDELPGVVHAPVEPPSEPSLPTPPPAPVEDTPSTTPAVSGDLEKLKNAAVEELKPLVDKLDIPADEKFDTLLLIIRTTDDQSLLEPAHKAAQEISDDNRRAKALLDIIKEVDYFSSKK